MSVFITNTDIDSQSRRPRTSTMTCLPLEYLNGWLFGINPDRVRADIRDKVIRYQKECYKALVAAFLDRTPSSDSAVALIHIREMGRAIMTMADIGRGAAAESRLPYVRINKPKSCIGQMTTMHPTRNDFVCLPNQPDLPIAPANSSQCGRELAGWRHEDVPLIGSYSPHPTASWPLLNLSVDITDLHTIDSKQKFAATVGGFFAISIKTIELCFIVIN